MDGHRPSRRAHILSSINPLREPDQTVSSHQQDPRPSPPPARESQRRAEPADEADDDDDDDDGYGPADPETRRPKAEPAAAAAADGAYSSSKPTKFRFKAEKRSSRRQRAGDDAEGGRAGRHERDEDERLDSDSHPRSSRHHRRHRHRDEDDADRDCDRDRDDGHHHHHSSSTTHRRSRRHEDGHDKVRSSKRRRRGRKDRVEQQQQQEEEEQEQEPEDPFAPPPLDADAAFRESLFDAMADDEGAAYWEGVYGQPIHTYRVPPGNGGGGGGGELEQMTADEYADYVRRRMWEKTHPGLVEARDRRERERAERARARAREDEDEDEDEVRARRRRRERRLADEMDRSLRRGQERRRLSAWAGRWRRYVDAWAAGGGGSAFPADAAAVPVADVWPVESGKRTDIAEAAVREFFARCADAAAAAAAEEEEETEGGGGGGAKADPRSRLKDERVRWHPDKVQQRLGGRVDEALMRDVTTVFQIVDKLWAEARGSRP
ncbi:hypothetical protein RB598_005606 [Gaeumannomyces tritici]